MKRLLPLIAMCLLLTACASSSDEETGVVARVDGRPIYLSQLEFQHDMMHLEIAASAPSVATLRKEYGEVLGQLIMLELVAAEMESRDLQPTDDEVREAEAKIRADYPPGAFEQILVEEYIDLDSWRRQLRAHLTLERFFQQVLRPQVRIEFSEAEDYYRNHPQEFSLPPRVRLALILAPERETVEKALEEYRRKRDAEALVANQGPATVRELTMREGQMPDQWRDALAKLQPGQNTSILHDDSGYKSLVLLERLPASVLSAPQAYPLIEQALAEVKLQDAFEKWLSAKLIAAKIAVSARLLPKVAGQGGEDRKTLGAEMELLDDKEQGGEGLATATGEREQPGGGVVMEPSEDQEVDQGDLEESSPDAASVSKPAGRK